jgi:hypothetical protein
MSDATMTTEATFVWRRFVRANYDPRTQELIFGAVSPEVTAMLERACLPEFLPARFLSEMNRALASVHPRDDVYDALFRFGCAAGRHIAEKYLSVLTRAMTPRQLAEKLGSIYSADIGRGRPEVDATDAASGRCTFWLRDMEAFDHMGPVCAGFMTVALETAGARDVRVAVRGWTPEQAGPAELRYDIEWSIDAPADDSPQGAARKAPAGRRRRRSRLVPGHGPRL